MQQLQSKIQKNHLTVAAQESLKSKCKNKLRNLAIIIATHWESGIQLREFASYVVALASDSDQAKSETVTSCQEFIEIFDKNKGHLLQESKEKYGF